MLHIVHYPFGFIFIEMPTHINLVDGGILIWRESARGYGVRDGKSAEVSLICGKGGRLEEGVRLPHLLTKSAKARILRYRLTLQSRVSTTTLTARALPALAQLYPLPHYPTPCTFDTRLASITICSLRRFTLYIFFTSKLSRLTALIQAMCRSMNRNRSDHLGLHLMSLLGLWRLRFH